MKRPLIVKNDENRAEYFGDSSSDAFGPIAIENDEDMTKVLCIDWNEFPQTLEIRRPSNETHDEGWSYPKLIKSNSRYVDNDMLTGYLSFINYFLEPVYFSNGYVGWSLHHYPFGFQPSPPIYDVGIWRRAYNLNEDTGMSPLGKYTFIRMWDVLNNVPAYHMPEEAYLVDGTTLEIVESAQ